jgi:hypothetical protein
MRDYSYYEQAAAEYVSLVDDLGETEALRQITDAYEITPRDQHWLRQAISELERGERTLLRRRLPCPFGRRRRAATVRCPHLAWAAQQPQVVSPRKERLDKAAARGCGLHRRS